MKMRIPSLVMIVFVAAAGFFGLSCRRNAEALVDLEGLRSSGDDWELVSQDLRPDRARVRFNHNKWLMYFLHWRPLTEEKRIISTAYARERMLSFWGPNMPFTITGEGGETEVSGHKAFFIEGTISEGAIRTRFIIWNCGETGRQFIADCNINVGAGTPAGLLELQAEVTRTISCHGQEAPKANSILSQPYQSKPFNLSFFIPENWRTLVYSDASWFPQGPSETNGTLWTLMTDSEKFIDLFWESSRQKATEDVFRKFLRRLEETRYEWSNVRYELKGLETKAIEAEKGCLTGEGSYELQATLNVNNQERTVKEPYLFKAFLWTKNRRTYFLVASLVSRQSLWGRSIDLAPTSAVFDRYVREEVLPRIPELHKILN